MQNPFVSRYTILALLMLLVLQPVEARQQAKKDLDIALLSAVSEHDAALVRSLLKQGANPNVEYGGDVPVLLRPSGYGDTEIVKALLDYGANVNARSKKYGVTPLTASAGQGKLGVVKVLLARGAKVNLAEKNGDTPFLASMLPKAYPDAVQIATLLMNAGAKIDVRDRSGETPLILAARLRNEHLVAFLLKHGVPVDQVTRDGDSALIWASREGGQEAVSVLLRAGARVNWQNKSGRTGLMETMEDEFNAVPIAEALLKAGANPNLTDRQGKTALIVACENMHKLAEWSHGTGTWHYILLDAMDEVTKVVDLLLKNGADPQIKDRKGKTALDYAHAYKLQDIVRLLTDNQAGR